MKVEMTTRRFKAGLDFKHWRRAFVCRDVTSRMMALGPAYYIRCGLPFDRKAADRAFHKMNAPGSPLRNMADLYGRRG